MTALSAAAREWRANWQVVFASVFVTGTTTYWLATLGVVMVPLAQDFGWGRGQISFAALIQMGVFAAASPFIGFFVARYGPRRLILLGLVCFTLTMAHVGLAGPDIRSWYLAWFLVALSCTMVTTAVWTTAVVRRFRKQLGLALGVALSGNALTALLLPPLALLVLHYFGWRSVYFALAGLAFFVVLPVAYFFYEKPQGKARRTSGQAADGETEADLPAASSETMEGCSFAEALRQPRYWRLMLALGAGAATLGSFQLHLLPMLGDAGVPLSSAAAIVALLGPTALIGRLGGGVLVDHIWAPLVGAAAFGLPVVNCFLLLNFNGSIPEAVLITVLAGLSVGAELDVAPYITAKFFGRREYAKIYPPLAGVLVLVFGLGGTGAGYIYDSFGSYDILLYILMATSVVSGLLLLSMGRYPAFSRDPS